MYYIIHQLLSNIKNNERSVFVFNIQYFKPIEANHKNTIITLTKLNKINIY